MRRLIFSLKGMSGLMPAFSADSLFMKQWMPILFDMDMTALSGLPCS